MRKGKTISRSALVLLLFLLSSCNYFKNVRALSAGNVEGKNFEETIPFDLRKGLIVVPGFINCDPATLEFIFDTGAFNSKVEYQIADRNNLKVVAHKNNSTAQGISRNISVVQVDSLHIGSTSFSSVAAGKLVYDSTSASPCIAPSGIIGANIIKLAHWKIDFKNQLLSFSDAPFTAKDDALVLPFDRPLLSGTPRISIKVSEREVSNILFDTGYNGGLVLPMSIADAFESVPTDTLLDRSTSGIYGTNTDSLLVKHLDVSIGGVSSTIPVSFSTLNKALLGNAFLKHFTVIINNDKNEIYLEPVQPVQIQQSHKLLLAPKDSVWEVVQTEVGLPFELGDVFVRVNGKRPNEVFSDYCDYVMRRSVFFEAQSLRMETQAGEIIIWEPEN